MSQVILFLSDLIIPLTFAGILMYAFSKKVPVYDNFIVGAKEGFLTVFGIAPTIVGLMVAVGMLRASGAFDMLSYLVSPLTNFLGYPTEAVPLTLMRLVSSSASTGLLLDLFELHGPDSFLGRFVSVMMSSTETVFYTMSIYFMSIKITKTRFTLAGALLANFAGVALSLWITNYLY
ncbi:MAG: spore maturation protein [Defluviitaleaceae bacterium]|nr:spore maturation protein [Defluviitaleaceae bacterium]MCL2263561.1 spore maturation protein [Defluviitaleaceae bacterium]